jgi:hypothetical protein
MIWPSAERKWLWCRPADARGTERTKQDQYITAYVGIKHGYEALWPIHAMRLRPLEGFLETAMEFPDFHDVLGDRHEGLLIFPL